MDKITHRQRFLDRINGKTVDKIPFFPDLSKWYEYNRYGNGQWSKVYAPGALIHPDDEINRLAGIMPEIFKNKNLFEIHDYFDCGIPVHGYNSYMKIVLNNVKIENSSNGQETITIWKTPKGNLRQISRMAADHSMCTKEYFLKSADDFHILEYIFMNSELIPNYKETENSLNVIGERGYLNLVINRSPMGKLLHDYMGIENLSYSLFDNLKQLEHLLQVILEHDRKVWKIAAEAPAKIAVMSDNMDEYLVSPEWYKTYFLPVYQEMNGVLHKGGKKVLTHMDGRMKNLLPMIKVTGFDVLDGCTPLPMNDFEPSDLAAALGRDQYAYCGIPAPFFIQKMEEQQILDFAQKIIDQMGDKLILCIGDIMPQNGKFELIGKISGLLRQ
ncbi:MAG: uroporphyrinogen decarboxylase family protein [bacterium]